MCVLYVYCVQKLLGDMELTALPTSKLILRFHSDLFQQCNAAKEKATRGTLTVSVGYLKHRSAVDVTVVAAKNLPGLDESGIYTCVCIYMYMYSK